MSRANPRKAMAALLPLPIRAGAEDVVVRPMTLGMWAALERIGSPMVTGAQPKDALELIPSLYLLTHDPREVFKGNILDLAMEWADTVPVSVMDAIKAACERQMSAAYAVIPELKKKTVADTTASSRPSSTGRRVATAGASRKSSGRSPCPRSTSSGGSRSGGLTASGRSSR